MNKHIVKYLLALATIAFVGGGCNVDDYNEEYLDGFNPDKEITDVQVLKYTMTDADYASVASNAANKAIAEAAGPDAVAALAAVGTAKCFSEAASATTYLPAFLAAGYDSYLSNGSTVTVTYKNQRGEISEAITGIASASTYELKAADYEVAWGEDITADYFTPGKPAANYLPRILKEAVKNAEAGDYVIAEYAYSEQEPSTGGGEIPETINKISEIIAPGDYTVQGTVSAAYARGFIVDDTTGAILVYLNAPSNYSLGDVVKVKGAVTEYNSGMQFGNTAEITLVEKTKNFAFPTAQAMSGSELDAYLTATSIKFVSLTGTLSISGNYYNLKVDGAATATGSLSFPNKGQIDESLDGKKVTATGYLFSVSKSGDAPKFANMMVATIAEEGSQPAFTPVDVVASADPGTFSVTGQIAATYKRGFLINDGTGSILIYTNADPTGTYAIGDLVSVEGTTSAYAGLNQYPPASTVTKLNTEANKFTYPAIREMDGTDMDGYLTLTTAQYVRYTGTLKIDGNYYNVINDEALTAQGSLSYVLDGAVDPALDGQEVVVEGYAIGVSGSKFLNTMVTSVKPAANASAASFGMTRAAVTKNRYAIYTFDGTSWAAAENTTMVNPEDYTQMGATNPNFSSSFSQDTYLPLYLKYKYPYALAEEKMNVAYHFYDSTDKVTLLFADEYTYDGADWIKTEDTETLDGPFKKVSGKWNFDPSMTLVVAPDRSAYSKSFYQACVDWVLQNKDAAYTTDNRSGSRLTDAEYYSGCAASYTNLNWHINTLPKYYWSEAGEDISAYDNWGSEDKDAMRASYQAFYDEVEKRFGEVMSAALGTLYPDVKMISGIDVIYTVQMMLYTQHIGSGTGKVTHAFEFKLVDTGKFEYVRMYALSPEYELMKDANFE